ncbi:MAG: hypothetical protein E6124_24300, partial [Blautia producta]|nr:hypothetical protein [Blautia producta]
HSFFSDNYSSHLILSSPIITAAISFFLLRKSQYPFYIFSTINYSKHLILSLPIITAAISFFLFQKSQQSSQTIASENTRGGRRRQGREREWDERRFTERLGDPPAPVT